MDVTQGVTYLGDSWFSLVNTCVNISKKLNANFIGVVKTAHSKYSKQFLQDHMENWPAGMHLVLKTVQDNVPLLAIGYKYNSRKVQCFIANKGAKNTEASVS